MRWVRITVAPRGRRPQRLVVALSTANGDEFHRDNINTDSARSRRRFITDLAERMEVECSSLGWLDAEIVSAAEAADQALDGELASQDAIGVDDSRKSIATQLVELASDVEFFHCPDLETYATFGVNGHQETARLKSKPFRRWLGHEFYKTQQRTPGSQAVQDAIGVLDGKAMFEGDELPVYVRVAEQEGAIYVDLCNDEWQAVEIDADGWRVVGEVPVKFRRAKAMATLPTPEEGGRLDELKELLNVEDDDWALIAAWLVAALRPGYPFPVLCLHGEQGSAKTTTAKVLRALIDPNTAPVRSEPRDARDLMIAANNGWTIALDNLSYIPAWFSDALCRLATGGGFSTRTLYEDDEETIFEAKRPTLLTGIDEVATRSDLVDRALLVSLPVIPEHRRLTEEEFWSAFAEIHPKLLGALFSAVSTAFQRLPDVQINGLPRMADFALWATAAEPALGLQRPFIDTYSANRQSANDVALEASPIAKRLLELLDDQWEGSSTELLEALNGVASDADRRLKSWPQTASKLSGHIKRLAPNLRKIGVDVAIGRTRKGRFVQLTRIRADTGGTAVTDAALGIATPDVSRDGGDGSTQQDSGFGREPSNSECDHLDPNAWVRRNGRAYCRGCDKLWGGFRTPTAVDGNRVWSAIN